MSSLLKMLCVASVGCTRSAVVAHDDIMMSSSLLKFWSSDLLICGHVTFPAASYSRVRCKKPRFVNSAIFVGYMMSNRVAHPAVGRLSTLCLAALVITLQPAACQDFAVSLAPLQSVINYRCCPRASLLRHKISIALSNIQNFRCGVFWSKL
jgi:hypothetical protein